MNELDRLIRLAEDLAITGEELSATFAAELALVFRDAERSLVGLVERLKTGAANGGTFVRAAQTIALKAQIRDVLARSGYDALVANITRVSHEDVLELVLSNKQAATVGALRGRIEPIVEALRQVHAFDLFQQGDEVATALWRSLNQHLFTPRPTADILADLADALDRDVPHVQTLFDTQVSVFGRQVEALATDDLGDDQPFLFVGPIDDRTRPFCLERVGMVFSRGEIDEMDNDQLPDVFLTGGGYSCRHSFLAVESQELRLMADTGERIPTMEENVKRVEARKAEKKRKAA